MYMLQQKQTYFNLRLDQLYQKENSMDIFTLLPLSILNWRDLIEILFFSCSFYYLSLWLKKDTQKNLLPYFYGFCLFTFGAHLLALPTVSQSLFLFSPAIILLFMFMHQSTLQRNMVALKNITHPSHPPTDWLTTLLRTSLVMIHHNKELLILIEHTDAIGSYLKAEYYINAPLSKDLLTLIVEHAYNPQQMLWIHSDGIIRGINVSWKASWHPAAYENQTAWIDDAIVYTSKNDALLLHINPTKHHYTIASNGTIHHELTIEQVSQLLRKKINHPQSVTKKGYTYDVTSKKNNVAQHIP